MGLTWEPYKHAYRADLNGLTIDRRSNAAGNERVTVWGSLHRWWHDGSNAGAFTEGEVRRAAAALCVALHIQPAALNLTRIEYGLNLYHLPQLPRRYIDAACDLNGAPFVGMPGSIVGKVTQSKRRAGSKKGENRTRLKVKLYQKEDAETGEVGLRVEVCRIDEYVARVSLRTFADLVELRADVVNAMAADLVDRFGRRVLWLPKLPAAAKNNPAAARTAELLRWQKVKGKPRQRARRRRAELEAAAGVPSMADELTKGIENGWAELRHPPKVPNYDISPPVAEPKMSKFGNLDEPPNCDISPPYEPAKQTTTQILRNVDLSTLHLTERQKALHDARRCVECGESLAGRRADTLTCSKRCRNRKSNRLHNLARKVQRRAGPGSLFPIDAQDVVRVLNRAEHGEGQISP